MAWREGAVRGFAGMMLAFVPKILKKRGKIMSIRIDDLTVHLKME